VEADQIEEEADEQMAAWGFKAKGRGETQWTQIGHKNKREGLTLA
jgi:hypothetical protein